jgi:ABC-type transporter Mla subunit MlaD
MTEYDKTSPNAVAYRDRVRATAIDVFEKTDALQDAVAWLANNMDRAAHLIDGDREDVEEMIYDLRATQEMLSRLKAKAGMISRRSKTTTEMVINL